MSSLPALSKSPPKQHSAGAGQSSDNCVLKILLHTLLDGLLSTISTKPCPSSLATCGCETGLTLASFLCQKLLSSMIDVLAEMLDARRLCWCNSWNLIAARPVTKGRAVDAHSTQTICLQDVVAGFWIKWSWQARQKCKKLGAPAKMFNLPVMLCAMTRDRG